MDHPSFLLAIDAGSSKTTTLLANEHGQILGRGLSAGCNFQQHTSAELCDLLHRAAQAAFEDAFLSNPDLNFSSDAMDTPGTYPPLQIPVSVPPSVPISIIPPGIPISIAPNVFPAGRFPLVDALVIGMGGADRPEDLQTLRALAREAIPLKDHHNPQRIQVMNDGWLLLWCGDMPGWGVGLISGTGSFAFGRDQKGHTSRAGGWGWRMGDEGSGYALGIAALNAVTHATDGRAPATLLTAKILTHWDLKKPSDLIPRIYRAPLTPGDIAQLAALVGQAAREGDAAALTIQENAARSLAEMVAAVVRNLEMKPDAPLTLAGGILVHNEDIATRLILDLQKMGLDPHPLVRVAEPALGALRLAIQILKAG
jgi:N-acetylglucosamine kinase-like BadF-type ATPase